MSNSYSGGGNHYNPNEPRDDRGRWTSGGQLSWAEERATLRDRSPAGLVSRLPCMTSSLLRGAKFESRDPRIIARVNRVLEVWHGASALDDRTFAARFLGPDIGPTTTAHLRAAARVLEAATNHHVAKDAGHLAEAVQAITPAGWPSAFNDMEARANNFVLPASATIAIVPLARPRPNGRCQRELARGISAEPITRDNLDKHRDQLGDKKVPARSR